MSTSRQFFIARGRSSKTKLFSLARPKDDAIARALMETFSPTIGDARRDQILLDSQCVSQWVCLWGDHIGFLTRPEYVTNSDDTQLVVGLSSYKYRSEL